MRRAILMTTAITLSVPLIPFAVACADTGRVESQIPAQDLEKALTSFASARGIKLHYKSRQLEGLKSPGVDGKLTAREALGALLAGTGLTFKITGENTVTLVRTASSTKADSPALGGGAGDVGPDDRDAGQHAGLIHLAQAGPGATAGAAVGSVSPAEVIVTAQKRNEPLLTVPVPLTVLEAGDLQSYNQLRIQDYFNQVPGLSIAPSVAGAGGNQQLAVRGIIAGQGLNPTVGVTIDGVPYGSSISNGGGNAVPDIDPSELARVEVLRGPQGTLFGANSLGGQLQYVTVDPSTDKFTARVQAGASSINNGDHAGYNARAAVNVPITADLAVRASAFTRRDPGYIDDVTHDVAGVNERDVYGGHFSAIWTPSADFSAKLSALMQHTEQFGQNFADVLTPGQDLSRLIQVNRVFHSGSADNRIQNYSLTLSYKAGTFDLTLISSFSQNNEYDTYDSSSYLSPFNFCVFPTLATSVYNTIGGCYGQPPVPPATGDVNQDIVNIKKYTQELRLTTPLGKHVDWLFGLFYSKEISTFYEPIDAVNPVNGTNIALFGIYNTLMTDRDEAAFTDLTFKINPRFDVQVGGRANINRQRFVEDNEGGINLIPDNGVTPGFVGYTDSKFTSYTYLLTPRYFLLSDGPNSVMTYARLASGFRPGGPNTALGAGVPAGTPNTYGPDKTYNYEIGLKADLLEHRLTLDVSLFYIDWRNIQISEAFASESAIVNGTNAKSQGLELQTQVRPWKGLTIDANFTYDDARLKNGLAASAAFADPGARLPFSAQYTGNLNVNQEFPLPLGSGLHGFVGGQLSYVGGRLDLFALSQDGFRQALPAYTQLNARAGVSESTWTAEVYATNLTDRRGFLSGGVNEIPTTGFYFITPLTVGFEVSQTF